MPRQRVPLCSQTGGEIQEHGEEKLSGNETRQSGEFSCQLGELETSETGKCGVRGKGTVRGAMQRQRGTGRGESKKELA